MVSVNSVMWWKENFLLCLTQLWPLSCTLDSCDTFVINSQLWLSGESCDFQVKAVLPTPSWHIVIILHKLGKTRSMLEQFGSVDIFISLRSRSYEDLNAFLFSSFFNVVFIKSLFTYTPECKTLQSCFKFFWWLKQADILFTKEFSGLGW